MLRPMLLILAALAVPGLAAADEMTDTLDAAREAYLAGDLDGARADLAYAGELLGAFEAEALATLLPEPLSGWSRSEPVAGEAMAALAMLGGGTTTEATYSKDGARFTLTLTANSPMISGMAAMAAMGGMQTVRIARTAFTIDDDEMQGVIDGRVLVTASGDASVADKTAHLERLDFEALADF